MAASYALKAAASKANPVILEPMMKVTVTVPEDNLDIMGHVTARRGRVEGMEAHGNSQIVHMRLSHLLKCLVMRQHFVHLHKDVVLS